MSTFGMTALAVSYQCVQSPLRLPKDFDLRRNADVKQAGVDTVRGTGVRPSGAAPLETAEVQAGYTNEAAESVREAAISSAEPVSAQHGGDEEKECLAGMSLRR